MENINANQRIKKTVHSAKQSRRHGMVPGILYGKNMNNLLFEIAEMDLDKEFLKYGEHGIVNINIEGEQHTALIKEIQKDPVNHKIVHLDLEDLSADTLITTDVPVMFVGENSVGRSGGILQKDKTKVKVQCRGNSVPKSLNVTVSGLNIGSAIRVRDVEFSKEVTVLDDLNAVLATISDYNTRDYEPTSDQKAVSDAEMSEGM